MLALRAGGAAVGWGFQLQSPIFVAVLAYLLFARGLRRLTASETTTIVLVEPVTATILGVAVLLFYAVGVRNRADSGDFLLFVLSVFSMYRPLKAVIALLPPGNALTRWVAAWLHL